MAVEKLSPARFIRGLLRIVRGKPRIPASLEENELLQVILQRRSVRQFKADPIPEDVFQAILEAGRVAPSTVNLQTWSFAVFDAAGWQRTFDRPIPFHASRAVIVIADTCRDREVLDVFPYSPLVEYTIGVMNASLAAMNMNIAAEALGVSSVMLSETGRTGILDAKYLKDCLNLPEHTAAIMTIVFGYARGSYPPMPPKLPAEELFFDGKYVQTSQSVMRAWLDQMVAGYKVTNIRSSFDSQLQVYRSKITDAERDLEEMVFWKK